MNFHKILFGISLIFLIFTLFIASGALGLKTPDDCANPTKYPLHSAELGLCYNELAVSYAIMGNEAGAEGACFAIRSLHNVYAEGQANLCFADIARMLQEPKYCGYIMDQDFEKFVAGAAVTKKICEENAQKKNKQPFCSAVTFVLAPLGFFLFSAYAKHYKTKRN